MNVGIVTPSRGTRHNNKTLSREMKQRCNYFIKTVLHVLATLKYFNLFNRVNNIFPKNVGLIITINYFAKSNRTPKFK